VAEGAGVGRSKVAAGDPGHDRFHDGAAVGLASAISVGTGSAVAGRLGEATTDGAGSARTAGATTTTPSARMTRPATTSKAIVAGDNRFKTSSRLA
jgi:hypothetical protein